MSYRSFCVAPLVGMALLCAAHAQESSPSTAVAAPPAKVAKPAKAERGKKNAADRLDLDKTVVTGNRELPKVLYIVPWKKSEIGDLPAQPFNTLLDEALAPVDRDVFKRELRYYDALQGAEAKTTVPVSQGEK